MSDKQSPVNRGLRPRAAAPMKPVSETFTPVTQGKSTGPNRVKTSLALDPVLYRRTKIAAIESGVTASEFIEDAMRVALGESPIYRNT